MTLNGFTPPGERPRSPVRIALRAACTASNGEAEGGMAGLIAFLLLCDLALRYRHYSRELCQKNYLIIYLLWTHASLM